jgi:AcrR family transcriptional regulator
MVRRYSMKGRSAGMEANRRAAIDAALEVLTAFGADGLTMQAVASKADMSIRSLYNYFETRDRLLAEVFSALVGMTQHEVELRAPPDSDPLQRLEHFVAVHFDILATQRRHMTVLLALRGVPELEERVHAIRAWRHRTLLQLLRDCGLRGVARERAAAAAFALTSFTSYTSLTDDLGLDQGETIKTVGQALTRLAGSSAN